MFKENRSSADANLIVLSTMKQKDLLWNFTQNKYAMYLHLLQGILSAFSQILKLKHSLMNL